MWIPRERQELARAENGAWRRRASNSELPLGEESRVVAVKLIFDQPIETFKLHGTKRELEEKRKI